MLHLFNVFLAAAKKSEACISVIDDRPEGLVDFVRDGTGKFTHSHDAGDVSQFGPRSARCLLGALPIIEICNRTIPSDDATLFIAQRLSARQTPTEHSVGTPMPELHFEPTLLRHGAAPRFLHSWQIVGMDHLGPSVAS